MKKLLGLILLFAIYDSVLIGKNNSAVNKTPASLSYKPVELTDKSQVMSDPVNLPPLGQSINSSPVILSDPSKPSGEVGESKDDRLYTIDKTLAVLYHPEETTVILQSDLRPGLDGSSKTLDQVVLEKLMLLDAKKLKIAVNDAEVDRRLARIQDENKLTRDDIIKLFKESGYTFEEGREQLRSMEIVDSLLGYRIKNKSLVDKKDIEKYYNENPIYQDATYNVSQVFVPSNGSSALKKLTVERDIKSGDIKKKVDWPEAVELKDADFSQEKEYIKNLNPDDVVILDERADGLVLLKMISKNAKKKMSIDDRLQEISGKLGKERFEKTLKEYHDSLMADAKIKYIK